jgi:hypothetical protein
MTSSDWLTRRLAVAGLALWHGDRPETFVLLAAHPATLVQRWPGEERTFGVLRQILTRDWLVKTGDEDTPVAAARLMARAFAGHPETPELLRKHHGYRAAIIAEFLGLHAGNLEILAWGLSLARELTDGIGHAELGRNIPALLIGYFGPRRDLIDTLQILHKESRCSALRASVEQLFQKYFSQRLQA